MQQSVFISLVRQGGMPSDKEQLIRLGLSDDLSGQIASQEQQQDPEWSRFDRDETQERSQAPSGEA
jgi:hypothetical protein